MKSFYNIACVVALAIGITGFGASAAQPNPVISKKEVKALIQTKHPAGTRCSASVRAGFPEPVRFTKSSYYYHGLLA
jgi:hypothetical protein